MLKGISRPNIKQNRGFAEFFTWLELFGQLKTTLFDVWKFLLEASPQQISAQKKAGAWKRLLRLRSEIGKPPRVLWQQKLESWPPLWVFSKTIFIYFPTVSGRKAWKMCFVLYINYYKFITPQFLNQFNDPIFLLLARFGETLDWKMTRENNNPQKCQGQARA